MKLLVTGASGQVGTELRLQAQRRGWDVVGCDVGELDITDGRAVDEVLARVRPHAVINAAAYTAVDRAEKEPDVAFAVNRDGPAHLAVACARLGVPLVHYSTDYVFDGRKQGAYAESDPTSPLGVYGRSKLAGEQAVKASGVAGMILRTSWVFSSHGHNFVKTMLRLGSERERLGIVADQFGKPTSAIEIARLTLEALALGMPKNLQLYHLAQPEATSWHGFAAAIFVRARVRGMKLRLRELDAITTEEFPTPARRPANSVLDCTCFEQAFGLTIVNWRESLDRVMEELLNG